MADEPTRSYDSPLREWQAAATRRAILQAAAELILRDGLADFSMGAVADRAEVSEGTVYYHFPSRCARVSRSGARRHAAGELCREALRAVAA